MRSTRQQEACRTGNVISSLFGETKCRCNQINLRGKLSKHLKQHSVGAKNWSSFTKKGNRNMFISLKNPSLCYIT